MPRNIRNNKVTWKSRAVVRDIQAGSSDDCEHCGQRIKFQAKVRGQQVICNVYRRGVWKQVEHFHLACYIAADEPHGQAEMTESSRAKATRLAAAAVKQREEAESRHDEPVLV